MKRPRDFPLVAKVLGWLTLHLLALALAFAGFVGWQLGLGLESLLGGSAGDRLAAFGRAALEGMAETRPGQWNQEIAPLAEARGVVAAIFRPGDEDGFPRPVPKNVRERAQEFLRPPRPGPPPMNDRPPPGKRPRLDDRPRDDHMPPEDRPPDDRMPPRPMDTGSARGRPVSRAVFLMRGDGGDGYWAGVELTFRGNQMSGPMAHELLLLRSNRLDGGGMFFDFKPWLWGGLAVLALSLALWAPFAWSLARYLRKLTAATERIAAGDFRVALPPRGRDELGNLGHSIETMAGRLDHLVAGQKRFLGDAAHELCAPLARLRTGVGILEMKLPELVRGQLAGIEEEAAELASLVEELLAFSRAGNRPARRERLNLKLLVDERIAREAPDAAVDNRVPADLEIAADAHLLGRALGNLLRNAVVHGAGASIVVSAHLVPDGMIEISITDMGPGVAPDELPHLFEPFYRPDRSRTRDTGGTGLGLAIVRTAMDACGGKATASLPPAGGFQVTLRLPAGP